jgi:hypothetical protein
MKVTFLKGNEIPQPKDVRRIAGIINVGRFGKAEVERAAGRLLAFLIYRGEGWESFSLEDLIRHYQRHQWDCGDVLYGLLGPWMDEYTTYNPPNYIIHCGNELALTTEFLERLK